MSLSVVVITKNEEENIGRCLSSVHGLADEIIVVDSGSNDKTANIAKRLGTKIYKRNFDNYASQRNFAIGKATSDWILSLDADEEISKPLATEISKAIKDTDFSGFLMPRKNIILGKEIKYSRWAPDKHVWLFKKNKGMFVNSIHEEIEVMGKVGELKNAKIHHSHKSIFEFVKMANNYTDFEAEEKIKLGQKFSYFNLFYFSLRSFIGRYFIKQGFRDGWRGFVLCYLRAIYQFALWVKIYEKNK